MALHIQGAGDGFINEHGKGNRVPMTQTTHHFLGWTSRDVLTNGAQARGTVSGTGLAQKIEEVDGYENTLPACSLSSSRGRVQTTQGGRVVKPEDAGIRELSQQSNGRSHRSVGEPPSQFHQPWIWGNWPRLTNTPARREWHFLDPPRWPLAVTAGVWNVPGTSLWGRCST